MATKAARPAHKGKIRTLEQLKAVEPPEWIWKGFLSPSVLTLLSSPPKVGKTTLLADLLRQMWTSEEYMGLPISGVATLVISEEADTLIAQRATELGYSNMWPIYWMTPEPGRTWDDTLQTIREFAVMWANPLIIVDTLSRHWGIDDENDNAKVESALNPLITIARSTGASILLVHHTRKSGGFGGTASRGGSAIVGAADIIMEFARFDKGDRTNKRRLDCYSRYAETPEALLIQLTEEGYVVISSGIEREPVGKEGEVLQWLRRNPGFWSEASITAASGVKRSTVKDALGLLTFEGSINKRGSGTRGNPFTYSAQDEDDAIDWAGGPDELEHDAF